MSTHDPFDFSDIVPAEVPVSYGGRHFILREASGDAAARYRNALLKSTKLTDGKVSSMEGMADVEPLLVSLCLWEINPAGAGVKEGPVSLGFIRSMPARIVKALFEKVKVMSDLAETPDESPLLKAISLPGSPVTVEAMRTFADSLDDKHEAFKEMLKPSKEEEAKNSPSATTGGSV
jgi:hypothetical protein